jgi:hypothetical protein
MWKPDNILLGGNSYLPSEMDVFTFARWAEGTEAKSVIGSVKKTDDCRWKCMKLSP